MLTAILDFILRLLGLRSGPKVLPKRTPKHAKGNTNDEIKDVQSKLRRLGYETSGGSDGNLGDYTMASVQDFLDDHDIVDPTVAEGEGLTETTIKEINKAIDKASFPNELPHKVGDDNDEIKRIQERLIALGHDMPRFGADGSFGDEMLVAVREFQIEHGIEKEDAFKMQGIGPVTLTAIENATIPEGRPVEPAKPPPTKVKIPAAEFAPPNMVIIKDGHKLKKGRGTRDMTKVTGACLHQTACVLGENEEKWHNIACAIGITRKGKIIWVNDFEDYVWHGHGFNRYTIGIEIDGHFAGLEELLDGEWVPDLRTYWKPKSRPNRKPLSVTPEQIEACKAVLRWLVKVVEEMGGTMRFVVAHRQSAASRISDPGEKVWKTIVLPIIEELGLSDGGEDYFLAGKDGRSGKPIPERWNPIYKGFKYRTSPKNLQGRPKYGPR